MIEQDAKAIDFFVNDQGSIYLLTPLTEAANAWCDENLDPEAMAYGGAIVVEHRYIADIVEGFTGDGLTFDD